MNTLEPHLHHDPIFFLNIFMLVNTVTHLKRYQKSHTKLLIHTSFFHPLSEPWAPVVPGVTLV